MNTRQVRSALAVVQYGSIAKAAQALHLAPSSISSQLKELNSELGIRLFEPQGRNIILSDVGKTLLPELQAFCAQEVHIKNKAQDISQKLTGTLSIFAPSSMCIYRLPELIHKMQQHAPKVEVLLVHEPYDYIRALNQGDIDAALLVCETEHFLQRLSANWHYEQLHNEDVIFVVPKEQYQSRTLTLNEVNTMSVIATEPGCTYRQKAEKHFQAHGLSLSVKQTFSNVEVIKKCVLGKMGIGLLPRCTVVEELESEILKEQLVQALPYAFQSILVYPKQARDNKKLTAFLKLLNT